MHRRLTVALAFAASLTAPHATTAQVAEPTLAPYEAVYSVSRGRMRLGRMHVTLERTADGGWVYRSRSRSTGVVAFFRDYQIDETTWFRVVDGRIVPSRHRYDLEGDRKQRDFDLVFDQGAGTVSGRVEGEHRDIELPAGAVDRHTTVLATVLDLVGGRDFPRRMVIVDRARVRELAATLAGEEAVSTPAGAFRALRIVQQRVDDPKKRFVLHVAPEHRFLPLRIQSQDDDGATVTLELVEFTLH